MGLGGFIGGSDTTSTSTSLTQNQQKTPTLTQQAYGDIIQLSPNISSAEGIGTLQLNDLGAQKQANDLISAAIPGILGSVNTQAKLANDLATNALNKGADQNASPLQRVFGFLPYAAAGLTIYFLLRKRHA